MWRNRGSRHIADLLYQELPLVDELLIVGPILKKMRQEIQELVSVHEKDFLDGNGLVWVGHKYFEDVESLILHHLPIIAQQVHANLQMLTPVYIGRHDAVV